MFLETESDPSLADIRVEDVRNLVLAAQFGNYICLSASHSEFVIASTEETDDVDPQETKKVEGFRVEYWVDDDRRVLQGRASLAAVAELMVRFARCEPGWMNGFPWVRIQ